VSTGNDGSKLVTDFWQFDPTNDSWKKKTDFPGGGRSQAVAFVYNNKGYIVTGLDSNGLSSNDFYSYNPSLADSTAWSELRHISNYSPDSYDDGYSNIVRYNSVGFVMLNTKSDGGGDRAYITTGSSGSSTWAYNFATDLWNQKTSYERPARQGAIGFTVQNRGFVGFGSNGATTFANIDEWKPDEIYNAKD
jgi:N-acetylneuraminic acid mutarotase